MSPKSTLSEEEQSLFRAAVKNVTPLVRNNIIPAHEKPKPLQLKVQKMLPADRALVERIDIEPTTPVGPETLLQFARTGLQFRIIQRLRRGEYKIEAVLDLHGLNLIEAEQLLDRFIAHALEKQWRCVQIIHGKGTRGEQGVPPLKNKVNYCLRTYPTVLAFCSARISDGGAGAVYVLLKSQ